MWVRKLLGNAVSQLQQRRDTALKPEHNPSVPTATPAVLQEARFVWRGVVREMSLTGGIRATQDVYVHVQAASGRCRQAITFALVLIAPKT